MKIAMLPNLFLIMGWSRAAPSQKLAKVNEMNFALKMNINL